MRTFAVFLMALSITVAAGCGQQVGTPADAPTGGTATDSARPPATSPTTTAPRPTPTGDGTDLTIVFNDGSGTTSTWRLTCDPPGGNHPQPDAACAALERSAKAALPAVPKNRACAEVYGGPQTAMVTGTWRGTPVNSRFSRVNACETARWNALGGLLPGANS